MRATLSWRIRMLAKRLPHILLTLCLIAASPLSTMSASAQESAEPKEDPGLKDVLSELLSRGEKVPATPAPPGTRVPFGRAEIQLSFAPLVKETAPAVVNVYASKQARAVRSPFAGDPFFERFFGRQPTPRLQSA